MLGMRIEWLLGGCGWAPYRGGDDSGGGSSTDSENSFDSGAMAAASGYDGPGDSGGSGLNSENSFDTGAMAEASGAGKGGGSPTDSALSDAAASMADFDTKSTGENDKGSVDWNTSAPAVDEVTGRSAEEQMQYDVDASTGGRNNASALNSVNQDSWNSFVNAYGQALDDGARSARAMAQIGDILSSAAKGALAGAKSGGIAGAALGGIVGAGKGVYDVSTKDYSKAEEEGRDAGRQSMTEALNTTGNWGQPGAAANAANGIGGIGNDDGSNGSNGGSGGSRASGVTAGTPGAVTPATAAAATGVIQTTPVATGITASGNLIPLAEQIWWKRSGS